MPETNSKLERFTQQVLAEANSEKQRILTDISTQRAECLEVMENELLTEIYHYVRDELVKFRVDSGRENSRRLLEGKRALASRREEIAHEVFNAVREKIRTFVLTPEYREHMKTLFSKAFDAIGNPYDGTVFLRQEDMEMATELSRLTPATFVEFKRGDFQLGGLILDCHSKMLRVDESFDTALADLDGHFAEMFGLSISDDDNDTDNPD